MNPDRWREVSRIYGAVLTLPESDRPAVLADLCAHDVDLRREVESLLHGAAGDLSRHREQFPPVRLLSS